MRLRFHAFLATALALGSVVGTGVIAPAAQAQEAVSASAATSFIQTLADEAFAVLRNESLTQAQRDQQFRQLLQKGFALDIIGNGVLGAARRTATPEQLKSFHAVFPDYVIRIYSSRLTEYGNSTLKVTGTAPAPRGDIYVRTVVTGPKVQQPIHADWRVRNVEGRGLKVIDLSLEGVSMAVTQRDEFNAKIQARGLDGLIAEMKGTTGAPAPAAAASTKK
ncbi:MlaC/ttg2D family ABC transporter substrate-binding protein [Pedomonas sp. V897]|uniref:MlaC/ttg2D family ABC transporter substrate-binding protein n=1 Tax=Pedomonas sp. V897 TaxID=3446482 RepID=UPI003EE1577E